MKKPATKPTDAVAIMAFIKEQMARGDWQGNAMGELWQWYAPDLGVSWPPTRDAGAVDALVLAAMFQLDESRKSGASSETAFTAGRLFGEIQMRWKALADSRKGKPRTDHFYMIADNLVSAGADPADAYVKAKAFCAKIKRPFPSPDAYKRHRSVGRSKRRR